MSLAVPLLKLELLKRKIYTNFVNKEKLNDIATEFKKILESIKEEELSGHLSDIFFDASSFDRSFNCPTSIATGIVTNHELVNIFNLGLNQQSQIVTCTRNTRQEPNVSVFPSQGAEADKIVGCKMGSPELTHSIKAFQ